MRILWFWQYDPDYAFDEWFHLDYVRWMSRQGIDIKVFGPGVFESPYRDLAFSPFETYVTLKAMQQSWPFNIIVCNTKSRMHYNYVPRQKHDDNCWLPKDFADYECPKVIIEEDYQYEDDPLWYMTHEFNMILQRHYSNFLLTKYLYPSKWLPFSVDTEVFKPSNKERLHKAVFLGHKAHEIYVDRKWATFKLRHQLDDYGEKIITGKEYIEKLRSYDLALCPSGIYNMTFAKLFEIASCGTVPLVNSHPGYGLEKLFSIGNYVSFHNDCFDIEEKVKAALDDQQSIKRKSEYIREEVIEKHSHEVRTKQLMEILDECCSTYK